MILLFGVSYLLYFQLSRVTTKDWSNLQLYHPLYFICSFLLLFVNWGLEWLKWRNTISIIQPNATVKNNFLAFMAGIATGLVTPNMLGNFIGRIYYYKRNFRPSIILLTMLANFSQFFASIFFGLLSLLILKDTPWGINLGLVNSLLLFFIIFLLVFYFRFEKWKWKFLLKNKHYNQLKELLKRDSKFRSNVLLISILRHFIFTLQFWLMFNAFEEALNFDTFLWIWQIFLWTTLVPSLWFGKLVIRESIALIVLGSVGFGQVEILTSSVLIWLINLALPAIISIFVCKQNKIDID
jgi:hypothetical protein